VRALVATWRGRFILAFLAIQLVAPLHYYLVRRDPHDERFAWRMFSPMRMAKCEANVAVNGQSINLYSEFHEAWVRLAERGRFVVIEEMAEKLCDDHKGKRVEVSLDCTYLERKPAHFSQNMCEHPKL
jgi:hypothetical protein